MAQGITSTSQVDPEVGVYFDNILLDREQPYFPFGYFAQERRIPQKNSKTAIFRRYDNLSDALTPLSEGKVKTLFVSYALVKPNLIDLEAYVERYGDRGEPFWDAERLSGLAA